MFPLKFGRNTSKSKKIQPNKLLDETRNLVAYFLISTINNLITQENLVREIENRKNYYNW